MTLEAALRDTVDEVGRVCAAESIAADFVKGGRLAVATTPAQLARLRAGLAHAREWGDGDDVYEFLSRDETRERINVAGALGSLYAPHSARVQPAALAAGLAAAAERRGVEIYEATPVTAIRGTAGSAAGAVAQTIFGDVRARSVLRCTEGYTAMLPGPRRALLPMNSHMVVTEPLPDSAWKEIGWDGAETLGDEAHAYMYAQRTADGRIALGGRGRTVPVRLGDRSPGGDEPVDGRRARPGPAAHVPRRRFGADRARLVRGARRAPRLVRVGELRSRVGPRLGGRLHRARRRRRQPRRPHAGRPGARGNVPADLPAVGGAPQPPWEPEPARWAGVHGLYALYRLADRLEALAGQSLAGRGRRGPRPRGRPDLGDSAL